MSSVNLLITRSDLKSYLSIAPELTEHDEFLDLLIRATSDIIEAYCNTRIKKSTVTELLSGSGTQFLFAANSNITRIHSIEVRHNGEFILLIAPEFIEQHLSAEGPLICSHNIVFRQGLFNYRISYDCGFEPVPDCIRLVCLELCAVSFKNSFRGEGRIGLMSNQEGRYKMFIYNEIDHHKHILNKFRRITI